MAESYKFSHWGSTSEDILGSHFPLHRACRDGDIEGLSTLLIEAQHGIYVEDSFYGWTPAHWAAYFGKLECLMRLHETGTNCDAATLRLNQTPAQIAAFAGQAHCLKWLLHCGASIDRQDYLGETPAHKAARTGSMECTSLLISHGAKLFIENISGLTPAVLAAKCDHIECSKFMESAAVSQRNDPRGVYQQTNKEPSPVETSPADITTTTTSQLPNGGTGLHINGHSDIAIPNQNHCNMEDDAMESSSQDMSCPEPGVPQLFDRQNGATHNGFTHGDVTLDPGVSMNRAPVAGHKRHREEAEDVCFKRQRTADGPSPFNLSKPSSEPEASVAMETSGLKVPESSTSATSAHAQSAATADLEPYQNILSVSCEPLKTATPTNTYHNNNLTCQYWAFVV